VVDGPHEPHEIEHGPERTVAGSFWIGLGRSCLRRAGQAITVTPEIRGDGGIVVGLPARQGSMRAWIETTSDAEHQRARRIPRN
jgi:hypothetical protein